MTSSRTTTFCSPLAPSSFLFLPPCKLCRRGGKGASERKDPRWPFSRRFFVRYVDSQTGPKCGPSQKGYLRLKGLWKCSEKELTFLTTCVDTKSTPPFSGHRSRSSLALAFWGIGGLFTIPQHHPSFLYPPLLLPFLLIPLLPTLRQRERRRPRERTIKTIRAPSHVRTWTRHL